MQILPTCVEDAVLTFRQTHRYILSHTHRHPQTVNQGALLRLLEFWYSHVPQAVLKLKFLPSVQGRAIYSALAPALCTIWISRCLVISPLRPQPLWGESICLTVSLESWKSHFKNPDSWLHCNRKHAWFELQMRVHNDHSTLFFYFSCMASDSKKCFDLNWK